MRYRPEHKEQVRRRILTQAGRLFRRHGYEGVGIDAIMAAAEIAVYQNGVRINEAFGDTVQFDLVPQFAIDRIQLSAGADPTYGLNALGGALALRLKNGFDNAGFRGELSGGSFGRLTATAQFGGDRGAWAFYLGATRFDETGWRVASPSEVTQAVADVGYRKEKLFE